MNIVLQIHDNFQRQNALQNKAYGGHGGRQTSEQRTYVLYQVVKTPLGTNDDMGRETGRACTVNRCKLDRKRGVAREIILLVVGSSCICFRMTNNTTERGCWGEGTIAIGEALLLPFTTMTVLVVCAYKRRREGGCHVR